jgi:hypothetical protein
LAAHFRFIAGSNFVVAVLLLPPFPFFFTLAGKAKSCNSLFSKKVHAKLYQKEWFR